MFVSENLKSLVVGEVARRDVFLFKKKNDCYLKIARRNFSGILVRLVVTLTIAGIVPGFLADTAFAQSIKLEPAHTNSKDISGLHVDNLILLALSPNERRAVFLFPDKKMQVVGIGESVPGVHAVLTDIMPDKVVIEETIASSQGKQVIWMWKGTAGAPGKIQRFASGSSPVISQHPPTLTVVDMSGATGTNGTTGTTRTNGASNVPAKK